MSKAKRLTKKVCTPSFNDEIRRLQKTQALLVCIRCAADEGAEFDTVDALAVIVALIDESLAGSVQDLQHGRAREVHP